ncbi:MAG TPA: hypothetical protein PKC14_04840 [Candidatus Absconditabacterales bacterium]|nr:hypothetical protein [Candidatus Absconditabacterales bacterium]
MHFFNLYEYVKQGTFGGLLDGKNFFDAIVAEDHLAKNFSGQFKRTQVFSLGELGMDFSYGGTLAHFMKTHGRILLVIEKLSFLYFLPALRKTDQVTVLNLGTGVSGLLHKLQPDYSDISIMETLGFSLCEPFDKNSFEQFLTQKKTYIRLPYQEFADNFFEKKIDYLGSGRLIDFSGLGIKGSKTFVVALGSVGSACLEAVSGLQDKGYDVGFFLSHQFLFTVDSSAQEKISRAEKLIFVFDGTEEYGYHNHLELKARLAGFTGTIHFLQPKLDGVTTRLSEYLYENAQFDAGIIFERLQSIIG